MLMEALGSSVLDGHATGVPPASAPRRARPVHGMHRGVHNLHRRPGRRDHREIQIQHDQLWRWQKISAARWYAILTGEARDASCPMEAGWTHCANARAAPRSLSHHVQNHHDIARGVDSLYDLSARWTSQCGAMFDAWRRRCKGGRRPPPPKWRS
jgi:hypothetical protein